MSELIQTATAIIDVMKEIMKNLNDVSSKYLFN